jgi:PDZ domain-containing protein
MTRRALTLAVAGLLLVALFVVAGLRPVPYVVMRPGPVQDTLSDVDGTQVVAISGEKVFPTDGRLDLTTVRVTGPQADLSLGRALRAWIDTEQAVVPRDAEQSVEEAEEESTVQMTSSQHAAAVAALAELGVDVTFDVTVAEVFEDAPAEGALEQGDVIVAVDGAPVAEASEVAELLQRVEPGEEATITVRRDGTETEIVTPTAASPEDPERTVVGISISDEPNLPFEIDIDVGNQIGGPSAGLMFSLAIVDKLTPGAMTGGLHIAGTGEIDNDGTVGAIGGIQQKIAGAARAGATAFLVPADNCTDALEADRADELTLVRVSTLAEARDAVEALADDPDADVPVCAA